MRDPIRLGSSGKLRAVFTDEAGDPIEATGVTVDIFNPSQDPDTDSPVTTLTPTYLGQGVFEVTFTPTVTGGTWTDKWIGNILGTSTEAEFTFNALDTGTITTYPTFSLNKNNLIEILLDITIKSTDGVALEESFSSLFTTEYSPLYSSVRKVKLSAGGHLNKVADDTINLALLEASIEADILTFKKENLNTALYQHARREYVTCRTSVILAENMMASGGMLKSKMLADFKVDYDTNAIMDLLSRMDDNCHKWRQQLETGGRARAVRNPKGVVKGELDPNRPELGRQWSDGPSQKPIANSKSTYYRRVYKNYKPRSGSDW